MPASRQSLIALAVAGFVLTLAVRLATLDQRPIWLDEAFSQYAISLDWSGLVRDRIAAGHSPVYFMIMKAVGVDPGRIGALRLISAAMDSLGGVLLGLAVARAFSVRVALFGMALYALNPVLLVWAQNARPYGMLMLCLGAGVHGAMGVIARIRQGRGGGADATLLSLGLFGASITLTAGTIAALLIGLVPLCVSPVRQARRLWLRAMMLPGLGVVVMLVLVSLPAAATLADGYWTNRYVPFGWQSARDLVRAIVLGDRYARSEMALVLGRVPWGVAALLGWAVLLPGLILGVRRLRDRPEVLPLVIAAVLFPLALVGLSLSTSLLVPRYFLPAIGPGLMLVAIGLDPVLNSRAGRVPMVVILACCALLALNQSRMVGVPRNPVAVRLAGIVLRDVQSRTVLYRPAADRIGFDMLAEVLPHALGPNANPVVIEAGPKTVADQITSGRPVYLAATTAAWQTLYRAHLPAPDCLWSDAGAVLAYWGKGLPAGCPRP